MRVLVTGGNGDLGRRVVPRLLAAGHDVRVGTRTPRPREDGAREVPGHLDAATLDEVLGDVEVVVHLASDPTNPTGDVAALESLLAAAETHGVEHVLYVSIVGIDDHPFPYYRAKLACERALAASGLPWTVLRATQFHGLPQIFAERLGTGPLGVAPSGIPFQPIDPEDVAAQVAALVDDGPSGRVPDLGGPQVLDLGTAMRRSLRAAGRRRLLLPLRLPKRLGGQAFRRGALLLPPDGVVASGRTFARYLDDEVAASAAPRDGVRTWLAVAGWAFLATAVWMAVAPQGFVATVAGFGDTVDHFIRDLATFTLPLGVALILAASRPTWRRPVVGLALLQNGLHLVNHLVDIGTTEPAWHGPVNVVLLAVVQLVLVAVFRAAGRDGATTPTADAGAAPTRTPA